MLHPRRQVDPDAHALAPPGVAVLTQLRTQWIRAGALDYATYADRVSRA